METFVTNPIIASIIALVVALLLCFFGYRLQKVFIALGAAVIGAYIGYFIANLFPSLPSWAMIAITAVVALIFIALSYKVYLVGTFLLGMALVAIAANVYITNQTMMLIVAIVGGIIVGILAVMVTRPSLIISSAVSGGVVAMDAVFDLFPNITGFWGYLPLVLGLVLAVIGAFYQFKTAKH